MSTKRLPKRRGKPRSQHPEAATTSRESDETRNLEPKTRAKSGGSQREFAIWPAYLSALLLYLSFPPVSLPALAWVAPVGWLSMANRANLGRRGYVHLWLSGCLFWLATLQGIRLAYWPLYFGWLALALYLAIYIPLFIGLTRRLMQRGVPLALSAPVVWVALEWVRSYALTGYCANMLAHTQVDWPIMIQSSDQLGAYGVSFLVMTCSVAVLTLINWIRNTTNRHPLLPVAYALVLLALNLGYGYWKLSEADSMFAERKPLLRALLVQENTPSVFDQDEATILDAWLKYLDLTRRESSRHRPLDLIVWPESTFTGGLPWIDPRLPTSLPVVEGVALERAKVEARIARTVDEYEFRFSQLVSGATDLDSQSLDRPYLLLGCDAWQIDSDGSKRFNSSIFVNRDGQYVDRYDKMHLVMVGEYFPLGPLLQFLRDRYGGVEFGQTPKSFEVEQAIISPNICFESMMPRVIRRQVAELSAAGKSPDVLVNLSNDSWFRGSSMLDHHLACSILCAVENRRPLLAAANTGITAEIDGCGRVLQRTERFDSTAVLAEPKRDSRWGIVQSYGYPLAWLCFGLTLIGALLLPQPKASE